MGSCEIDMLEKSVGSVRCRSRYECSRMLTFVGQVIEDDDTKNECEDEEDKLTVVVRADWSVMSISENTLEDDHSPQFHTQGQ